jgi:hypothetical protein
MRKVYSILLIIFAILFLVTAAVLYNYLKALECPVIGLKYYFGGAFLLMGSILLFTRMRYLKNNKNDEYNSILREFDYLRHNTHSALFIGVAVSTIMVGIAICFFEPEKTNVFQEKIFEILTLYLSFLATLLVIRAIFDKIGPITEVEKLLKRLKEDFEELSTKRKCEAYIVYPALTIGNFREESELVLEKNYAEFSTAVETFAKNQFTSLIAITYNPDLYEPLYEEYSKIVLKGQPEDVMKKKKEESVRESHRMFDNIKNSAHLNSYCFGLDPTELREHFIVIDDIVYTITSFGIPEFKGSGKFGEPELMKYHVTTDKLAKLYAFRQQDKEYAELVKLKIKKMIDGKSPAK